MANLHAISLFALVGAGIGVVLLLAIFVRPAKSLGLKTLRQSIHCHLCQRPVPADLAHCWTIRGTEQRVCDRCHPHYKQRFSEGMQADSQRHKDTATVSH